MLGKDKRGGGPPGPRKRPGRVPGWLRRLQATQEAAAALTGRYRFTVEGPAVGYAGRTRGQQGAPGWERFKRYRDKVRLCFPWWDRLPCDRKVRLEIVVYYGRLPTPGSGCPDPDHVLSAILDCLFREDSLVASSVDWEVDAGRPRVEASLDCTDQGDPSPCP